MEFGSLLAIYFVIWWLCLFLVLPFSPRGQIEDGTTMVAGTDPGAPRRARALPIILLTSLVAAIVTALLLWGLSHPILQQYWD